MIVANEKTDILQSLSGLDAIQSEQVLDFIKALLNRQQQEANQQNLDKKALKDINRALSQPRLWI
ncbi:MAG TPA: hypothetical protein VF490_13460 [Chryseosolibacter sp.]